MRQPVARLLVAVPWRIGSAVLRDQVARFWSLGRPVGAICHGVLVLARTHDLATAWRLGRYYRTYPAYVEEVKAALADPAAQFRRGPITVRSRGTATSDTAAFVVPDRNYLSARWPGDAYLFARRFCQLLQPPSRASEPNGP